MSKRKDYRKKESEPTVEMLATQAEPNVDTLKENEMAVVGGVMLWPDTLAAMAALKKEHFRSEKLGLAYESLQGCDSQERMFDALLEAGWKGAEIAALGDYAVTAEQVKRAATHIMEAAQHRKLKETLVTELQCLQSGDDSAAERIARIHDALDVITPREEGSSVLDMRGAFTRLLEELQTNDDVVPTGYSDLDRAFRGWPKKTLTLIAGRPGMGKSAMCLNVALRLAKAGRPVLYVGLEDNIEQHTKRLFAAYSHTDLSLITPEAARTQTKKIGEKVTEYLNDFVALPIYFAEGPLTASQVTVIIRQHVKKYGIQAAIVDHAQEILPDTEGRQYDQRTYEIQASAQKLRDVAKDTGIAVILAAQINREAEKSERPRMCHLRDSGSLEMIARLVLLLYRDEVYNEKSEDKGVLEVGVGKANHGPSGGEPIRLAWIGERCEIAELAKG